MGIVDTKYFTNKDGVEMKTDIYANGMTITQEVNPYVPEPVVPEPTDEELFQAEMMLMQAEILENQNAQDEVLAEILLNQIGG